MSGESREHLAQKVEVLESELRRVITANRLLSKQLAEATSSNPEQHQLALNNAEHQLRQLKRKLYGESSERQSKDAKSGGKKAEKKQTGHGPTKQTDLPVVEEVSELDEADKSCVDCGGDLRAWEGKFEESEYVDVIDVQYVVVTSKRQKYRCKCGHIDTALAKPKLVKGGRYSPDFAIQVAVGKYCDHLPLSRQVQMMKRRGLKTTTQALSDQMMAMYHRLAPLEERLRGHLVQQPVLGMDETTWHLLDKKAAGKTKSNSKKKWFAWAMCSSDAVLYRVAKTRGGDVAKEMLNGFTGDLITDDYIVYGMVEGLGINHRLCWSHARRKFLESLDNEPLRAQAVVDLVNELYSIDRSVRGPPPERSELDYRRLRDNAEFELREARQLWSQPVLKALHRWAHYTPDVLPGSTFGNALTYLRTNFDKLAKSLEADDTYLDNNHTERALRAVVLGRKNHYGSKSERATKMAALMYSLVGSAKLCGIEPERYLREAVAEALADRPIPLPHEI